MPHVNGVRAIAIIAIFFYHLYAPLCTAGYFGVDLFLLMTGYFLLGRELEASRLERFHYGSFLLKKIWRIMPPAMLVGVLAAVAGCLVETSDRCEVLLGALGSAALCFSNDYVAFSGGYFSPATQENPLMHFWYLGLTMQIYVLIPLFFLMVRKGWLRTVFMGALGVASLLLYASLCYRDAVPFLYRLTSGVSDVIKPYYSLCTRLWEPLLALVALSLPALLSRPCLRGVLAWCGLLLAVVPMFLCPVGSACSYPVLLGGILLLRYGSSGVVGRFLGCRLLQWAGKVSFSLYLVHWVVFALWKYVSFGEPGGWGYVGMAALSCVLAWLLWLGVESRCARWQKEVSGKVCAVIIPGALLLIAALSAFLAYHPEGKLWSRGGQLDEEMGVAHCSLSGEVPRSEMGGFPFALFPDAPLAVGNDDAVPRSFLLMGDSHAWHLHSGLDSLLRKRGGLRGVYLNNSCLPAMDCYQMNMSGDTRWNRERCEGLLEWLESRPELKVVVISDYWAMRMEDNMLRDWEMNPIPREESRAHLERGLSAFCKRVRSMGKRVILVKDTPFHPYECDYVDLYKRHRLLGQEQALPAISRQEFLARTAREEPMMQALAAEGVEVLDLSGCLMSENGEYPLLLNGRFLYRDTNHLSAKGSLLVAEALLRYLY